MAISQLIRFYPPEEQPSGMNQKACDGSSFYEKPQFFIAEKEVVEAGNHNKLITKGAYTQEERTVHCISSF
jgi:hypothetical protein